MADRLAVGIDIGGTKIAAGVVDEDGRVIARTRRETPTTEPEAVLDAIVEITAEFRAELPVKAVGIGAAGFVDVRECAFGKSDVPDLDGLDKRLDEGPAQMALEAVRP